MPAKDWRRKREILNRLGSTQSIDSNLKLLVVLQVNFAGNLHEVVGDEVVDHLEGVEKGVLVELIPAEEEADAVKNFFVLGAGKVGHSAFLSYFECWRWL